MMHMKWRYWVFAGMGVALCAGLWWFATPDEPSGIPAGTGEERMLYLFAQGFKGREQSVQEITVPDVSDVVFADYAALQAAQGLPLAEYSGKPAVRYVYTLEQTDFYAELLVADSILIGAMCCNPAKHEMFTISGKPCS
jgi:hypothetical protein